MGLGNCIKTLFSNLFISVLKLNLLLISFISTEYTEIFSLEELKSASSLLDSILIPFLFMRSKTVEET